MLIIVLDSQDLLKLGEDVKRLIECEYLVPDVGGNERRLRIAPEFLKILQEHSKNLPQN